MKHIPFYHTRLDGAFWGEKQRVSKEVTVDAVYDRFVETKRFEALKCDAAQQAREGWHAHFFWDSDIAKWIEGTAYILERGRNETLEAKTDAIIDDMCANQMADGYYNCYFKIYDTDMRFTLRTHHELYCLGHLIEAAIAYRHATGKDKLLGMVERYVDYVIRVFTVEKTAKFVTPGHEEIELALVKLYRETGKQKYLELAKFFVDKRGANALDPDGYDDFATDHYSQDHLPVRQMTTAEGHSVSSMYLYIAMADLVLECGDDALFHACEAILKNIAYKRMYITGGIGSSRIGEAFTVDYDLKNETAYTETCAAVALALFCQRMSKIKPMGWYADTAELAMYNGSISGVSMAGDEFFYENPLTIDLSDHNKNPATKEKERYPITQRLKVFGCSCCPPNILRFINAIGDFMYTEDADMLYVHHYMNGKTAYEGKTIRQTTAYPACGKVKLEVEGYKKIAVRVPGWCTEFEASAPYELRDGYAYFEAVDVLDVDFHIQPRLVVSSPSVHDNAGRAALLYGPVVYCMEGVDNKDDIFALSVDSKTAFELTPDEYFGMPRITADGYLKVDNGQLYTAADAVQYEKRKLHFIPYYAMENRGETDMQVWTPMKY